MLYTVILCVMAPLLHKYVEDGELVRITLSPVQNERGPLAEIMGAEGGGSTVKTVPADEAVQPLTSVIIKL